MKFYAWSVQLVKVRDWKKQDRLPYEVSDLHLRLKPDGEDHDWVEVDRAYRHAYSKLTQVILLGRKPQGIVVCMEGKEITFAVCSSCEKKFSVRRGVEIAKGRMVKLMSCSVPHEEEK
jgi:hypothetical protein